MRGQLELSFGFIFSLIIIIATIGTASYFIMHFIATGKCTAVQLAYADLQEGIDDVWGSAAGNKEITLRVPSGITSLCIGDIATGANATLREVIDAYVVEGIGIYALPPQKACGGSLASKRLAHVAQAPFFCKSSMQGKVTLRLSKADVSERTVTIHA